MSISIATTNTSGDTVNTNTSHTVNLPASIASGDLLIVVFASKVAAATWPAGYTEISNTINTVRHEIRYRIADGSEGASITITTAASATAHISYRITGWHGSTPPEVGTASSGASGNLDPPSITPSWGSAETLFVATAFSTDGNTVTGYPTNYGLSQLSKVGGTGGGTVTTSIAGRLLTASSDDPGVFTPTSGAKPWVAQTIAVRPAATGTTALSYGFIF